MTRAGKIRTNLTSQMRPNISRIRETRSCGVAPYLGPGLVPSSRHRENTNLNDAGLKTHSKLRGLKCPFVTPQPRACGGEDPTKAFKDLNPRCQSRRINSRPTREGVSKSPNSVSSHWDSGAASLWRPRTQKKERKKKAKYF